MAKYSETPGQLMPMSLSVPQPGVGIVRCPYCGDGNVHLSCVSVVQSHDVTVVSYDHELGKPFVEEYSFPEDHPLRSGRTIRGSEVAVRMFCEGENEEDRTHTFDVIFSFHKGVVSVDVALQPYDANQDTELLWEDRHTPS